MPPHCFSVTPSTRLTLNLMVGLGTCNNFFFYNEIPFLALSCHVLVLTAVLNLNTLFWSQLLEEGGFSQMKVTAI